jgi:hypothetical protein
MERASSESQCLSPRLTAHSSTSPRLQDWIWQSGETGDGVWMLAC